MVPCEGGGALMATRVGYIGLGQMGKAIAINVVKAGFDLMAYDLREEPLKELAGLGARTARSPREVGEHGEIIETSVVDDAQVEAVMLGEEGVLKGARPGAVIALHSTIHPETVRRVAEAAAARGVGVIDAPVSGGEAGARAHTLCYMVGGDPALLEKCRPVFATSGAHIFHMGGLGMGVATKLSQQAITMLNRLSASEGMLLAKKAGLDLERVRDVVHVTSGQSRIVDDWLEQYGRLSETPASSPRELMRGFYKGLLPILRLAHELGIELPGVALTQQRLAHVLGIEEEG